MTIITSIEGMDSMAVLGSDMVHDLEILDDTIENILETLLGYQKRSPIIELGYIHPEYANKTRSIAVTSDSILQAIHQLRQTVGGYIDVDNNNKFNWNKEIGENKGQQIRYNKNLVGIERDIDYSQICNRIYVYGATKNDGTQVSLKDYGLDEEYIDDVDSQDQWGGIYVRVFSDKRITHPDTLYDWAVQILQHYKDPIISYSIDAINLSNIPEMEFEKLKLGSLITVIDEDLGIDVKLNIVLIRYPNLDLYPNEISIELATKTRDITDALIEAGVYDTQQLEDSTPTQVSAGQVIVKGDFTVLDWVTSGETTIKGDSITSGTITADQLVKTEELITNSAQIKDGTIENAKIKDGTIENAKIKDGTIENAKIKELSAQKISGQIVDTQILEVEWAKIKNVEISEAQIGSISADKITAGTINANISIGAGKITAGGVAIDSSGIMIDNSISDQALRFKKGVVTASISADTDGSLRLTGNRIICHTSIQTPALVSGGQLLIRVGNYEDVVVDLSKYYSFKPYNSGYGNLGESGYRWDNIYANNINVPTIDSTTVYATNVYAAGQVGANVVYANNFLLGQGWASNNGNIGYQWHNDKLYLRVYYNGKWYYTDPLN